MTVEPIHPLGDLQLVAEDRLPAEREGALATHLADCAACRRELEALRAVRSALRTGLTRHAVPPDVTARIMAAIAAEASPGRAAAPAGPGVSRRTLLLGGAALAAAAGLATVFGRFRVGNAVDESAADFQRFVTGELRLDLGTTVPNELERFFEGRGLGFPTRVFDFGMMGYQLAGGSVHRVLGRDGALFAYRGSDERSLVCQMFPGSLEELPAPESERVTNRIRFHLYARDRLSLVFWEEGSTVCALASADGVSAALDLAAAKAVLVEV